jgi:hypothetical protein
MSSSGERSINKEYHEYYSSDNDVLSVSNQFLKRNLSVCASDEAEDISSYSELPPEEFEHL